MTTSELDELAAETAASMTATHPDYAVVSLRSHKPSASDFWAWVKGLGAKLQLLWQQQGSIARGDAMQWCEGFKCMVGGGMAMILAAELPVYERLWDGMAVRAPTTAFLAASSKDCSVQSAQEHAQVLLRDVSPPSIP